MATIYAFKNFNNYYNRKLKGQTCTTITDFLSLYGDYEYIQTGTTDNFDENDGVVTSHVLGRQSNPYSGNCDYLLVCKDNNTIDSKWFIVDQDKQCFGQYKLNLYRDVISDYWTQVKSAPMLIEKAILSDDNPLIFNSEDISLNQIKTSETLLKDETGVAWIIGLIATNYSGGSMSFNAEVIPDYSAATKSDLETTLNLSEDTLYKDETSPKKIYITLTGYSSIAYSKTKYTVVGTISGSTISWAIESTAIAGNAYPYGYSTGYTRIQIESLLAEMSANNTLSAAIIAQATASISDASNYDKAADVITLEGKVAHITTGADTGYYDFNITSANDTSHYTVADWTALNAFMTSKGISGSLKAPEDGINTYFFGAKYNLVEVASGSYNITFPDDTDRLHLKDAPYDMFCIPYGNIEIQNSKVGSFTNIEMTPSLALTIAQGIAKELGNGNIIDLQLVPYCPMTGFNLGDGYLDINNDNSDRYTAITKSSTPIAYLLWSTAASGSKTLSADISISNYKVENQCDMYRLCSPNYNGQFEFSAAKNGGVSAFNIDFSYIPYQPYIHINPVFNRLYGGNFGDARGLICAGDFSISYLSDQWINYQVQNKNYQNIFDREVQNMEVNHKYDMLQTGVSALTGAAGAGVTAGILTGNPVIGALAGGLSLAGGAADMGIKQALYNEALDYKKDLFGYQLDNIKALPYSLAKVSTINKNNKIFPFIEYYTCTDTEKTAFANKIAYNSMKVGVIGTLEEYIDNTWTYNDITDKGYIKGQLIRIEGVDDDTHVVNAIAEELNKGVFTK